MHKTKNLSSRLIYQINIPNVLTLTRILLVPVFIICIIKNRFMPSRLIFTVAGISDALDGFIARYFNQRTELGAYLDPTADKLLITSSYISLSIIKIIPAWIAVIVISRDVLIILGIAIFTLNEIKIEIRPTFISKLTTVAQLTTIFITLLNQGVSFFWIQKYSILIYTTTALFTIISGLHYTYKGLNFINSSSKKV